jgi:hypothetical protein
MKFLLSFFFLQSTEVNLLFSPTFCAVNLDLINLVAQFRMKSVRWINCNYCKFIVSFFLSLSFFFFFLLKYSYSLDWFLKECWMEIESMVHCQHNWDNWHRFCHCKMFLERLFVFKNLLWTCRNVSSNEITGAIPWQLSRITELQQM